jgi:hypothetical protein
LFLVAMALAELGRCAEATEWQRRMIAVAEQEHKGDLLAQLNPALRGFAPKVRMCVEPSWYGTACGSKRVNSRDYPVATATGSVPDWFT